MSLRVTPSIDPLAHRAAIEALEAQRAAYQRYARAVDAQRDALAGGSGERAIDAADAAARGYDALAEGARTLAPLVDRAREGGGSEQQDELQRRLDAVAREARVAEAAIHNLAAQLEAWRDAYGRQLAEVGIEPGSAGGSATDGATAPAAGAAARPGPAPAPGYGPRGRAGDRQGVPSLLDRKG